MLRIGTSGWAYKHWRGGFYPPRLRAADWLTHYAEHFDTVELNGVFYRLPNLQTVAAWARSTPDDFCFAWKASKYLTHAKKLTDPSEPLGRMAIAQKALGEKLGPVLFQLPPQLHLDLERLAPFLKVLDPARRHVIEFRHPSWYGPKTFSLLGDFNVALCISDHHDAPAPWEATATFVYVRGHGPGGRYTGRYSQTALVGWAGDIARWRREGRQAWVYFDNDINGAAPLDALRLRALCR